MPAKNTRSMRSTRRDGTPVEDRDLDDDLEAAENRLAARKIKQSPSKAAKKRKHSESNDGSDDESGEDDDYDSEMNSFIADDEEVERELIETNKDKADKKKKKAKKQIRQLEDEDFDLIKENAGISVQKKKRLNRIRDVDADMEEQPVVKEEERPMKPTDRLQNQYKTEEAYMQKLEPADKIKRQRQEYEDQSRQQKNRKIFGEGEARNDFNSTAKPSNLKELFGADEIDDPFNTEQDLKIAENEIPERLQLKLDNRMGTMTIEDLQAEAKWILDRLQYIPDADNKLGKIANAKGTEDKVLKVLKMFHQDFYDIPLIVKYRKYEYDPELDEDAVWHIWNLDHEYGRYQKSKKQIHDFLFHLMRYESSVRTYLEELKFAKTQSELNNFSALIRYLRFIFADQLASSEDGTKKQPQSRDEIQIARANNIHVFARECFIESKEFQENLQIRKLQNSPPEPKASPNTVASDFTANSKVYSEPSELLQAACRYAAVELASQPAIRAQMKFQLKEMGVITCTCTEQGKKDIDIFHQSYRVKLVENMPLKDLKERNNGDLFLDIHQCEKSGLVTSKIELPPNEHQKFKSHFEECYMDTTQPRQGWNVFRQLVIKILIDEIMFKEIVREVREELMQDAEQCVISKCKREYTDMLMTGPFQTALAGQDFDKQEQLPPRKKGYEEIIKPKERLCVMGALMHQIDANNYLVTVAVVNKYGILVHHKDFMRLLPPRKPRNQGMRDGLGPKDQNKGDMPKSEEQKEHEVDRQRVIEILDEYSVDLIVVAANGLDSRRLMEVMQELGVETKNCMKPVEEGSKKQQQHHAPKEAFVIWGSTEIAKLFSLSHYSQKLHKGFQQILKQTISLARYEQCPMTEILKLWSPIVAENQALALNLDPLQKLVNQTKLADALEECNIRAVNNVGVDFNLVMDHEHMQCVLPFLSGLGFRKAKRLIQKVKNLPWKLQSRGQLLKSQIIEMKTYFSVNPFLLIRIPAEELDHGQATKLDILDQTRIHHEHYRLACKIATDACNRSENQSNREVDKAEQNLNCREVIQKPSFFLKNLDLKAYYQQLEMSNQGNLRIMIDFIIEEFKAPFADPRKTRTCDKTGIDNEKLFYLLIDESKRTFKKGLVVTATVTNVLEQKAICRLESGLTATIVKEKILEHDTSKKLKDVLEIGFIITGRIEEIRTNDDKWKFEVQLNCKKGDLHNHDKYLKDLAESIGVDAKRVKDEDRKNLNFSEQQQSNKPQSRFVARRIAHERFKNISSKRALTELEHAEVGEFIFRPSTRSENAITLTWKFWKKQFVHIDIQELDKMPGAAIGQTLMISQERYENLREIVERYIIPCNRLVREVVQSPKWSDCEKWEELEEQLKDEKASDKARIPYRFAILPNYQQYVVLAYVPRERVIKEFIKVRPMGFYFHEQNLAPFQVLVNWFKDQWQTKDYQRFLKRQKSPRTTVKLPEQQQQIKQNFNEQPDGGQHWQQAGAGSVYSNHGVQYGQYKQESRFRGQNSPGYGHDQYMKHEGGRSPHYRQKYEDVPMDQYDRDRRPAQRGGEGCYKCGQSGHFARECPSQDQRAGGQRCYNCQQMGHISRDCPGGGSRQEEQGYKRQRVEGGSLRRNADGGFDYQSSGWGNQGNQNNWGDQQQQNNYTPKQDPWGR